MKDRFTDASLELTEKSAFACQGCETTYGHPTFMHLDTMTADRAGEESEVRDATCIFNCDPMPFGD